MKQVRTTISRFICLWSLLGLLCPLALRATPDPLASLRAGHPRLLATPEDFARFRQAEPDPLKEATRAFILSTAEGILQEPVIVHHLEPASRPHMLVACQDSTRKVLFCATAFRLKGDRRYLDRAVVELRTIAALPDWNPNHFLDTAVLSYTMALGYDWLYDDLTPTDRQTFKAALLKHALVYAPQAYGPRDKPRDPRLLWVDANNNWKQICNTGLLLAALAVAEDEPDLARLVVNGVRASLPDVMESYAPDGAFPEGPGYWEYGTGHNVIALAALESALGSDLGLVEAIPAFTRTAGFRLQMQVFAGKTFTFADVNAENGDFPEPAYGWLAGRYGPPATVGHMRALLDQRLRLTPTGTEKSRFDQESRFYPLHLLWLPAARAATGSTPLDVHFRGPADLAILRSAWGDPEALYVGFKAGSNNINHGHLDLGSFVLGADGVCWSTDLGKDNYALPGYFQNDGPRWRYFRLNNLSHSTLTPGEQLQAWGATAPIVAYDSTPDRAYATADLTEAYPRAAGKILRTVAILNRARVLVRDDLQALSAGVPLRWRMMTGATITVAADGRSAVLSSRGKQLRAELLAPANARFAVKSARPPTAEEEQNDGFSILQAEVPASAAVADVKLTVLLTPIGPKWPVLSVPAGW